MSLQQKLKIKTTEPLYILGADERLLHLFGELAPKQKLTKENISQMVLFVRDKSELNKEFPQAKKWLQQNALLWIAYPKKSGSIPSDLIRDEGWEIIYQADWEGVASASINEDWSGMRFRHKTQIRNIKRALPIEERKTEGIDYIHRTVQLPKDAVKAMKSYKGLEQFFNAMSFTHKKEYAEAIAQAKKPETRERRIQKMIEMVNELKNKKEKKQKTT